MNISDMVKNIWANKVAKTIIVTAGGGAAGVIEPMIAAGTFVLNSATIHMAIVGAGTALWALYIHKPTAPTP